MTASLCSNLQNHFSSYIYFIHISKISNTFTPSNLNNTTFIFMGLQSFHFSEDYPSFSFQQPKPTTNLSPLTNNNTKRPKHDFDHDTSAQEFLTKLLDNSLEPSFYQHSEYENIATSSNNKRPRSPETAKTEDLATNVVNANGTTRRLWVKNRSNAWWEQVNSPNFPEQEFKKAFRMSRATFNLICEELESVVTKKNTMLRLAIPVPQRVAVCIWRLATGEALREVSKRFGLGISTCHKLVLEVCTAIKTVLMPKVLQWPDEGRMKEVKREFEALSRIPNVGGSMYTTHVPIIAPKVNVGAYFNKRHTQRNQKTTYTVTVQGVVDTRGVFTDVCIGWPGSMTDDQVLEKSSIFDRVSCGDLKDVSVVGGSGYPLMDWTLVPYTHQNLTWTQHAYNEKIDEVQRVAKEAFMRLKARWSCLKKRTEMKLDDLPVVLGACCVLHNICEMNNEGLSEELRFEIFDDEMVPEESVRSVNAMNTRDQIAHKLLHYNQAGTSFA